MLRALHTFLLARSGENRYEVWRSGRSAIEVETQVSIIPLFDALSLSGEYTAPDKAFMLAGGVAYRAHL